VGSGGWYCDDKAAIHKGAIPDGYTYQGQPVTAGFSSIHEPGQALCIVIETDTSGFGFGDAVSVTYAGQAGRREVFNAHYWKQVFDEKVSSVFTGREIVNFRSISQEINLFRLKGEPLHPAIEYGLSQALLNALAIASGKLPAQVLAEEYGLKVSKEPIKIVIQSGDDRHNAVDKAILKRVDIFPHGLINDVETKFGRKGEILLDYAEWIKKRIAKLAPEGYRPAIHFDLYGSAGEAFQNDLSKIVNYFLRLGRKLTPYPLQLECPVEMSSREEQVETMAALRRRLQESSLDIRLIADEWCNTIEDIKLFAEAKASDLIQVKMPDLGSIDHTVEACILIKEKGIGVYLGGSCNETDISARLAVQVGFAVGAEQILARPGMGVDEGIAIVRNEMARSLLLLGCQNHSE